MALYRCEASIISRGKGQSVVAAAAYQARDRLHNEQDGLTKDYTRHHGQELLECGIYAPKGAPAWVFNREQLWNAAEEAEDTYNKTRAKDAQTARRLEVALPHELNHEQNRRLLQDFLRDNFTRKGFACDVSIHGPHKDGDQRNTHAHILVTMRTVNAEGFNPQKPHPSKAEQRQQLEHWRENWARQCSRHLERAGFKMEAARMIYAHRTLEEQQKIAEARNDLEHAEALKRAPTLHEGPTATKMKREGKGAQSWRVDFNQRLAANRAATEQARAELARVKEAEQRLSDDITPEGRKARLDRRHEWQRDQMDMQHARDRLQQQDAHAWARREDAAASPVLRAWRERERAREAAELARQQAEQREALLEQQAARVQARQQADQRETLPEKQTAPAQARQEPAGEARPQPAPSFDYRPPRPAYWSERIRSARQSEAAREREEAAARYHERVMREQNTRHAPQAARPEGDIKGSRDPAAWWTDPQARDPARPEPKTPEQELLERLRQRERERKAREQEEERQPGRSIADDWLDGMMSKKDGPR